MDEEKVFKDLGQRNESLWQRLQEYSSLLTFAPNDAEYFTTDKSASMSFFINGFCADMVSAGDHYARVNKWLAFITNKKERMFGHLYVTVTDELLKGKASSKYDKEYRTGKVMASPELKQLTKDVAELQEYVDRLKAIFSAYEAKKLTLTTLVKLDKNNYY